MMMMMSNMHVWVGHGRGLRVGKVLQPARRAALGQAALQRAQQLFDLEHQAQQYLAWFAELQAGADSVGVS